MVQSVAQKIRDALVAAGFQVIEAGSATMLVKNGVDRCAVSVLGLDGEAAQNQPHDPYPTERWKKNLR